jgi:YgiT-type zinc finger domain-containing protein
MSRETNEPQQYCDNCRVGSLQPCRATYARWHNGQFVVLSGVSAWRCDLCGDTSYDSEALTRLILLLGPESELEVDRPWRGTTLDGGSEASFGDRRRV